METADNVAGIDVHKRMLAVVIANARDTELQFERRRFGTTISELLRLSAWLSVASDSNPRWGIVWRKCLAECRDSLS